MTEISNADKPPEIDLATLRVDIDRIDAEMHRLLMERGEIIDRLIQVKARQGGGSAFRPGREADMMRRLVQRHKGLLPLDTVEGIWRIIISTFTYVQAHYRVHVDASAGDAPMRDTTRFHFGFTVPYIPQATAENVVNAVSISSGDLGIVPIEMALGSSPWWQKLHGKDAPKIIARLPFVDRLDHPAGMPVFILAQPLAEAAARDVIVYSVAVDRWRRSVATKLEKLGGEVLCNVGTDNGLSLLMTAPGEADIDSITAAFVEAGMNSVRIHEIGSHAARHQVRTEKTAGLSA
jgi:chorismate mutase